MKDISENNPHTIDSLSFDKLLSLSKILRGGVRFGKYCCLKGVCTDRDRDIFKYPIRLDAYIFVVCSDGLIELTYNLYQIRLLSGNMFISKPGTILCLNALEPSQLNIMVFTREFIDEIGLKVDNLPLMHQITKDRQIFSLSESSCDEICSLMMIAEKQLIMRQADLYYEEMTKALFKSFIYRALYEISAQCKCTEEANELLPVSENNSFDKFMRLLEKNYVRHHSIKFYSDKMCLSPKYLSLLIKKVSGKLATQWIDEYVILEAKNLIKYSSMSIQEITYALNFPNQSFFGKYFKRHTGLSPKAYRMQK